MLLKEIHHRVKNNLQITSSLLYLQATRTEHPGPLPSLVLPLVNALVEKLEGASKVNGTEGTAFTITFG